MIITPHQVRKDQRGLVLVGGSLEMGDVAGAATGAAQLGDLMGGGPTQAGGQAAGEGEWDRLGQGGGMVCAAPAQSSSCHALLCSVLTTPSVTLCNSNLVCVCPLSKLVARVSCWRVSCSVLSHHLSCITSPAVTLCPFPAACLTACLSQLVVRVSCWRVSYVRS